MITLRVESPFAALLEGSKLDTKIIRVDLVYVSTEYVFDGKTGKYREEDPLNPVNTYARSKLAGELIALSLENALVVRTSFCHARSWKFPRAFIDQYTSRDSVDVIAPEILAAAHSNLRGIVHIAPNERVCSSWHAG